MCCLYKSYSNISFAEIKGAGKAPSSDIALGITKRLLEIPPKQRSIKALLTEGNLRPSRLWSRSTLNRTRDPYPHVKDFLSYIWIRRSFEILQHNLHFLPPLTDVERRFAVMSMASTEINVPGQIDSVRRYREEIARKRAEAQAKKRQAAGKSTNDSVVVMHNLESLLEESPSRKRQKKAFTVSRQKKAASGSKGKSAEASFVPDSPMELLASGLSSFEDPEGFLKRSNDFILITDDLHLKNVKTEDIFNTLLLSNFQAYQATLHLHGRYKAVNDKGVALRKAGDALKAENTKLAKEKEAMERQKVAVEEELKKMVDRH
ncbi:hypothetical protein LWI29_015255 [Acer saccharum]|uniref:Uncharacterized protein n=1 Tax=Acer saccharum TaxID=4024 RepID=A0AA39VE99_ACESA|nr:hypothetical protein LWI29_015255 [Acer saccharum]